MLTIKALKKGTMKKITQLDQVNMLIKHASRNNLKIKQFITCTASGNVVYAACGNGVYFTIYCFIENAGYLFDFI